MRGTDDPNPKLAVFQDIVDLCFGNMHLSFIIPWQNVPLPLNVGLQTHLSSLGEWPATQVEYLEQLKC